MANIRVVHNNLSDLASVTVSGSASASMGASNLKTEIKTEVWRSNTLTPYITVNWTSLQSINCVIVPCTNLSETATIRVQLYDAVPNLLYDSGVISAIVTPDIYAGSATYNVNLFSYGFFSKTAVWFPTVTGVDAAVITFADPSNPAGYIDCSRLIMGSYWEPTYNVENGIQLLTIDDSNTSRTNAGNLVADRGFIYDKVSFNYALLPEADKSSLANIIRAVGTYKNFFISVFPEGATGSEEHDFMIYGKRVNSPLTHRVFGFYNHTMEIVSW